MIEPAGVLNRVNVGIQKNGMPVRLRFFTSSWSGADYDNEYITQSGTDQWIIGLAQPVVGGRAGLDAKYLAEGTIKLDDRKLYVVGSITFSGQAIRIGLGSPTVDEYKILPDGIITENLSGVNVFHKIYMRRLPLGSMMTEFV